MRTYLKFATAALGAVAVAAGMAPAAAATRAGDTRVLTINKVGGPAVQAGAVLKARIPTGKKAVFTIGSSAKLSCTAGHVTAKVLANPAKPGIARESLTAVGLSKCTVNVPGVTVKSIKANNLPYKVAVSDAAGFPVTVSQVRSTKPLSVTAVVVVANSPITCTYKAAAVHGHASNTGNVIAFSKQKFTFASGSSACTSLGTTALFSGTFGPVRDASVTGSPKVFVN